MKALRGWMIYGALLAFAAAVALATHQSRGAESKAPSIDNPGPLGAKALKVYLEESGHPVLELREPLTAIPSGARTLVVAAPAAREVTGDEVSAIEAFVRGGGTLVYLTSRPLERNGRKLDRWLDVSQGARLEGSALASRPVDDLGGASVRVSLPFSAAHGISSLRVSADTTVRVGDEAAVPVAGGALWWMPRGDGGVWLAAGADLVENRRLELEGNLGFWENLAARGPMAFDEHHHTAGEAPPVSLAVTAFALQLLAFTAVLAIAHGARLGPARPELAHRHRGSLEYLESLAHLTRRAKVERELIEELPARLRLLMQERLGIALSLPEHEAALELERRCRLPATPTLALLEEARMAAAGQVTPGLYARLARDFAQIERVITGRAPPVAGG